MKKIKFSHDYLKIPEYIKNLLNDLKGTEFVSVTLLEVFVVDKISEPLIEYDTVYQDPKTGRFEMYKLPKGKVLVLLFEKDFNVFTTIRRWTPEKEKYYKEGIGESFELVKQ